MHFGHNKSACHVEMFYVVATNQFWFDIRYGTHYIKTLEKTVYQMFEECT